MTPVHLTYDQVVAAAQAAYDAGTLQAQTAPSSHCYYRSPRDNSPCAIGAALTDEQAGMLADRSMNGKSVQGLIDRMILVTDEPYQLNRLQRAHDRWSGAEPIDKPYRENQFKELIGR